MSVTYLQLLFFGFSLLLSFYRSSWGAYLCAATIAWWELPLLILGYPNLFLIDLMLLGFIISSLWKTPRISFNFSHPFLMPLILACLALFVSHLGWIAEKIFWSAAGFSFLDYLSLMTRHLWFWNVASNPVHDVYLLMSYLIQLGWIICCFFLIKKQQINKDRLIFAFVFGSLPIIFWAILQKTSGLLFYPQLSNGASGSFQNPNHLGFYSGLILLFALYGFLFLQKRAFLLPFICALIGCYLGESRSAWIALISGLVLSYWLVHRQEFFFSCLKFLTEKKIFAITLFLTLLAFFLEHERGSYDPKELISYFLSFFHLPANRADQYFLSIYTSTFYPLTGLGAGLFFRKVPIGFEEHSLLLWSFNSFGWPLTFLAGLCFLKKILKVIVYQEDAQKRWFSIFCSVYLIICLLPDHYFSYHSLLSASALVFVFLVPKEDHDSSRRQKNYKLLIKALACFLMICPLLWPHSSEVPTQLFSYESQPEVSSHLSRWTGPFISYSVPESSCVIFDIRPLSSSKKTPVFIGELPENARLKLPGFASLSDHRRYGLLWSKQNQFLKPKLWQKVCFCNQKSQEKTMFMMSAYGDYLSLSPDYRITDDRFLAFQVSKEELLGPSSDKHLECDVAYYD